MSKSEKELQRRAVPRDLVAGFGPALRAAREASGMSLADVAGQIGSSAAAVSKIELEQRSPSLRLAVLLADAVGKDIGELVRLAKTVSAAVEAADRPKGKQK